MILRPWIASVSSNNANRDPTGAYVYEAENANDLTLCLNQSNELKMKLDQAESEWMELCEELEG